MDDRKIIAYYLDLIEGRCDAIVCYWDQHAGRGAGTQSELTFAHRLGIPVYLICGMPVEEISGWLLGCGSEVFAGFDDFRDFVNQRLPQPTAAETRASAMGNTTRGRAQKMNAMRGDLGWTEVCRRCFEPNLAAAESQKKKKAELAATVK